MERFNDFARALATGRSRRDAIKLLIGGAAGIAVAGAAFDINVAAQATECPGEGDSCENTDCCDGFTCNDDLVCTAVEICSAEGESCENMACCDGLSCDANLACVVSDGTCGFENESCENRDCCDGLVCSDNLACVIPDGSVDTGGTATQLPDTGAGPLSLGGDNSSLVGLAALGGAAAIGGMLLKKREAGNTNS